MDNSETVTQTVSRRRFLQVSATATGGLALGISLPFTHRLARAATDEASAPGIIDLWLRIDPQDQITILIANSEMGQGVYTSLAMLVAEELEVPWQSVKAEMAPAAPAYKNLMFGMQATGGSTSIRWAFDPLRQVGAAARLLLTQAAANQWNVAVGECFALNATVTHKSTGRTLRYGELVTAAAQLPAPDSVELKLPADWTILGTPVKRLDTPSKINGSAQFGIDVVVPDMLVAAVLACPTFGGKLKSVDDAPALAVSGVKRVLLLEDAVIVVADGYWPANKGLAALDPEWDLGVNAGRNTEHYRKELASALVDSAPIAHASGDAQAALASSERVIEALYEVPHLAHSTMEPMNATAHVGNDGVEVWAPTQAPGVIQQVAAGILQLPPESIVVNTTFLGGGFGRKFEVDFVIQAIMASKMMGAPVKLVWSREEDTQHDFYRPAAMSQFRVALNSDGYPTAWHNRIACPSILTRVFPNFVKDGIDPQSVEAARELPYKIAHQQIEYQITETGVPVGFWRSVGNSQNAYFVQSMIDELAAEAGIDALDYQLTLLADQDRHKTALQAAADSAGWRAGSADRPMGLAVQASFGSICAMVVEIDKDVDKGLRVTHVSAAIDCGRALNPDTVVAQIESSIVYGLTAAYYGDITLKNGAVEQSNFDNYPMLKLAQMPVISVDIIQSGAALGGIGEPGLPPLAPALCNAVFAATGTRVRRLPLSKAGFTIA